VTKLGALKGGDTKFARQTGERSEGRLTNCRHQPFEGGTEGGGLTIRESPARASRVV